MRKVLTFLTALFCFFTVVLTAYAHDVPQNRTDCSIEVIVRYDGQNVNDGTLTVIKVGYVDENDGDYFFSQEMTGVPLENIDSPLLPGTLKAFYINNKDNYTFYAQTQSVKDGKATFSGLSTGLYLIVQDKAAEGFSSMDPFLVGVPYMEDGVYQYQVTALLKTELQREPAPTKPSQEKPTDPKLPQTGQMNWPVPLLAVAGLTLFVIGWVLCFGKKRDPYEN